MRLVVRISSSPFQRYQLLVADIMMKHRMAIRNRIEWMCSKIALDGKVTISGDSHPTLLVDFKRNAAHTVTYSGAARWGIIKSDNSLDRGNRTGLTSNPIDDIKDAIRTMSQANFGGSPSRILMGYNAYDAFIAAPKVRDQIDTRYRTVNTPTLNFGIDDGQNYTYQGNLGQGLEIWTYYDYYHNPDRTKVDLMSSNDILLVGGALGGIKCYGAIQDHNAQFQPLDEFSRMWYEDDPPGAVVMTQSAPIPFPMRPNATMKITVCAKT